LSTYRQIYSDCVATVRKPNIDNISYFDLLSPNITPLRLTETGHKEALIFAAITKIDRCEAEKDLTRKINVGGTLELIKQLVSEGIKPIFFSSDYVFDGISGNYADDAPTNPITEYGRQKAEVEARIDEITKGNYLIVRLSKVFSLNKGDGSLLDEMASALANGDTIRAAYDQIFCPTLISDVISAVAYLQSKGITGIINVCSQESWSRYDLAVLLAEKMGIERSRISKVSLDEIGFKANRPKNTSMIPKRLLAEKRITFTPISGCIEKVAKNWSY
jgi:dTDP-4-dehydrorhamnose reductase